MTLAQTERRVGKTKVRLTARGRLVRNIVIVVIAYLAFAWVIDATTPDACKVPVEKMSYGCKALLYP